MEYAIGHREVYERKVDEKKGVGKKQCPGCDMFVGARLRVCNHCRHVFFEVSKKKPPKKHVLVEDWKSLTKKDVVFIITEDVWTSPDLENIIMGDDGEFTVHSVTEQGILCYSSHGGYAFFDMVSRGLNPVTGIKRGETRIYKLKGK